jgi:hypothetical protein
VKHSEFRKINIGDNFLTLGILTNENGILPAGSVVKCASDLLHGPSGPYRKVVVSQTFVVNAVDIEEI